MMRQGQHPFVFINLLVECLLNAVKNSMDKKQLVAHGYFSLWVFLLSLVPLGSYWWVMPRPDNLLGEIYRASSLGYYGLLLCLVALLLAPLSQSRWTRPLYALVMALWLIYLAIDVATFNLYLFHVDWVMIEMFILDFAGMGIPPFVLALAALVALACLLGLGWLSRATPRMTLARSGRALPWIAAAIFALFLVNSCINIWADRYQRPEISYINPYLPLYRPVTSGKHAHYLTRLLPGVFPATQGQLDRAAIQEKSVVNYPLAALECTPPAQPASILLLLVESWQADTLNPEIMPNLARFSEGALRFDQHLSGGSATVPGLFSLFYGLHASYYPIFKATPAANPSLFTETLAQQGYSTRVYTNTNLERFAMRQLLFPRVPAEHFHKPKSDSRVVREYLRQQARQGAQPRFDFVFLTSSHSPYKYPQEFAQFQPLPRVKGGYVLNKHSDNHAYKNDYYNSLVYVDHLIGRILEQLEQSGELERTWVVITGDHGEEFNENAAGFWGHGSNFTRWQTQTPLLVRPPGLKQGRRISQPSTHQDLVPTLMREALGCTSAPELYSNGTHLLALPEQRSSVISSYYNHAYWVDGQVLDRSTGREYTWGDFKQATPRLDKAKLRELHTQERRFLKTQP